MTIRYNIFRIFFMLLSVTLMTACSSDVATDEEQPLPDGMGRIRITISAPENAQTRAVNAIPWEDPDHEWESLQTFRILICGTDNKVVQVISGTKDDLTEVAHTEEDNVGTSNSMSSTHKSATLTSAPLAAGSYYIYAVANFTADEYADNYAVGKTINPDVTKPFANSSCYYIVGDDTHYNVDYIRMTGKLTTGTNSNTMKEVPVANGTETDAGTISVWRVMAKMQFEFTNESNKDVRILGIEVDPINKVSTGNPGIYLFSKDDLESTANLAPGANPPTGKEGITLPDGVRSDMGAVEFVPPMVDSQSQPLTLAAKNDGSTDEGKLYFYVNESDATFTTTNNQYSVRFKVQRQKADNQWYEEEIRYGVTTHYGNGTTGQDGFNVIRRNDWIHIPIVLTDWQFSIEPLAFVPIAGYPATTISSDALTATFSTGGMIALQPFVRKYNDNSWRDFSNSEITFKPNLTPEDAVGSIHWKNIDGEDVSGTGKIVKTPFIYDDDLKCIIGELNNDLTGGPYKTTFTVSVRLNDYDYTFTFNIILQ